MNIGLLLQNWGNSNKVWWEEKKKEERGVQSRSPLISVVCLLFSGGEGLERLCGRWYQKKKKKIHQLRIGSPPLKVYLNNMFRFCLKPFRTTSAPRIHHYLGSWAIKDDPFCYIMNCSIVWTKVMYFDLCDILVTSSRMSVVWEEI